MPEAVVTLSELKLVGLLVGDPDWTGFRWACCVPASSTTGEAQWGSFFPPVPPGLPRHW